MWKRSKEHGLFFTSPCTSGSSRWGWRQSKTFWIWELVAGPCESKLGTSSFPSPSVSLMVSSCFSITSSLFSSCKSSRSCVMSGSGALQKLKELNIVHSSVCWWDKGAECSGWPRLVPSSRSWVERLPTGGCDGGPVRSEVDCSCSEWGWMRLSGEPAPEALRLLLELLVVTFCPGLQTQLCKRVSKMYLIYSN